MPHSWERGLTPQSQHGPTTLEAVWAHLYTHLYVPQFHLN